MAFTGHGTGFKPGYNPGPYDPKLLGVPRTKEKLDKLTEYDLKFPRMLLPDDMITDLFIDATDEKGADREDGNDKRKVKNESGTHSNILLKGKKYKRAFTPLTTDLF